MKKNPWLNHLVDEGQAKRNNVNDKFVNASLVDEKLRNVHQLEHRKSKFRLTRSAKFHNNTNDRHDRTRFN